MLFIYLIMNTNLYVYWPSDIGLSEFRHIFKWYISYVYWPSDIGLSEFRHIFKWYITYH
jgi:hypothetical protein